MLIDWSTVQHIVNRLQIVEEDVLALIDPYKALILLLQVNALSIKLEFRKVLAHVFH